MLLCFVAYGLSIWTYVRAQRYIGAAKTSAFYTFASFIGAILSFIILKEKISLLYLVALVIMIIGTYFIIKDTIKNKEDNNE